MIEQRHAYFQRMRHARAINLGQDVARQISLQIQVLYERQRIIGWRARRVVTQYIDRVITLQLALQGRREQAPAQVVAEDRNRMEIGGHRIACQRLEGSLGAEHARRPVSLGIQMAERPKHRAPHVQRQQAAHRLFGHVQLVASIAGMILVTAVARQRHRDPLARQFTDPISRQRGAVGIGFVVEVDQLIDQRKIIGVDLLGKMIGAVLARNLCRIG